MSVIEQAQICEHCNQVFHRSKVRKYCSEECYHADLREAMPQITCLVCGTVVRVKSWYNEHHPVRFCSDACAQSYQVPYEEVRSLDSSGYVRLTLPDGTRVREHRVVMEAHLGRPLTNDEHIHHINGDKTDNRIENLQIVTSQEHALIHSVGRHPNPPIVCARCKKVRKHGAKGYCKPCYTWLNLQERKKADPEGMREKLRVTSLRSYNKYKQKG